MIRRQLVALTLLVAITVAMFIFTRNTAANLRDTRAREAATWYTTGQDALGDADIEGAITAFRQAADDSPGTLPYALALTAALGNAERYDEARPLLLRLRETAPEHPEINLQLARLFGAQSDVSAAVRYYQNALYGVWPEGQTNAQRQVRIELVRFLLDRGDRNAARSELLVLSRTNPEDPAAYVQIGRFFLEAGAPGEAWPQFEEATVMEPEDGPALAGAGEALFELGDYAQARRYLEAAEASDAASAQTNRLLTVTTLVLSSDPLAPRLRTNVRERRLVEILNHEIGRLQTCPSAQDWDTLWAEAETLQEALQPGSVRRDPDLAQRGFELAVRIEKAAGQACVTNDALSEALLLIERRYEVDQTAS